MWLEPIEVDLPAVITSTYAESNRAMQIADIMIANEKALDVTFVDALGVSGRTISEGP